MKTTIKNFHWVPRIICILAILFISLFALDAFESQLSFWQQLGAFLIHLIPTYILIAILWVVWKWELIGGIMLLIFGLATSPLIYNINYNRTHSVSMALEVLLVITFPFVLTGILFIVSHYLKKKQAQQINTNQFQHS